MNPQQSCQSAESNLRQAQQLLRAGTMDQCLVALAQVIEILEEIAAGNARDWDPAVHLAFHRIRDAARDLHTQVDLGSNMIRGWMQLRFGAGYTRRGLPEFTEREPERLLEA
jgi:hypothetical protein